MITHIRRVATLCATLSLALATSALVSGAVPAGAAPDRSRADLACEPEEDHGATFWKCADIPYVPGETHEDFKLDVYIPDFPPSDPVPVVVMIHGGGWMSGGKQAMANEASYFVRNGLAAVAINYSLSNASKATWPTAFDDDVQDAVAWVLANQDTYGLDADPYAVYAESAGGQLAALLLTDNSVHVPPPASTVTLSGVMDLKLAWASEATHEAIEFYLGCPVESTDEPECAPSLVRDASPTHHVDPTDEGRMLLFHSRGEFVPFKVATKMAQRLAAAEIEHKLYPQEGKKHAAAYACDPADPEEPAGPRVIDATFTWLAEDLLGSPIAPRGYFACPGR